MAQRASAYSLESALGQFVRSQSTVSELREALSQEYETWRTRDLSQEAVASLCSDTGYEPVRRWGQKTGVVCGWVIGAEERKVLLSLSTANRESYESWVEVLRGLGKRGRQTPVTLTTEGARGLTQALEAMWPLSLRMRGWFHTRQNLPPKVPALAWPECTALVVDRRAAPTREQAEERRDQSVAQSQREFPAACRCLLDDAAASLNPRAVPQRPQHWVRTSNLVERALVEARHRTKVIPQLFAEGSLVNLVSGVLLRVSERWGKQGCSEFEPHQIRSLRGKLTLDEQEGSRVEPAMQAQSRRSAASAA